MIESLAVREDWKSQLKSLIFFKCTALIPFPLDMKEGAFGLGKKSQS